MEQIKDMVTLRAFALDKAVATFYGVDVDVNFKNRILNRAKDIESYILGEAKIPEVYDTDAHLKEFSKILRENTSHPSFSMSWISPYDTVKPRENEDVLVMCRNYKFPMLGEYIGDNKWLAYDAGITRTTADGEIFVEAWLPIPKYNGSTL